MSLESTGSSDANVTGESAPSNPEQSTPAEEMVLGVPPQTAPEAVSIVDSNAPVAIEADVVALEQPAESVAETAPPHVDVPPAPPAPIPVEKADRSALLRALALLVLEGASLGAFFSQLTVTSQLDNFVSKNEMASRLRVELSMGITGLVFLLGSFIYLLLGRRSRTVAKRVESLHRLGVFMSPAILAILVPPFFRLTPWATLNVELLVILTIFGIVFEPLMRVSLSSVPMVVERAVQWLSPRLSGRFSRWTPPVVVGLAALGYAAFASIFTIMHHYRFGTACWDLGQYDNLFYNALHGHPFRVTSISGEEDWKSLRGHAELGMYFILPFYGIRASSEALLVLQAVLLGSAAIPVYLFSKRFVSRWTSMVLALVYVFYAPLHRSNFYDFHMQPIAAAFILWMLYFFISNRNVLFWIFFVIALTAREDISIALAVFGTFLMVTGYRARVGVIVTIISVIYFIVLKGIIMPLAGGWWFIDIYKLLQIPGKKGYGSVIETLLSNPFYVLTTLLTKEKLILALQVLLPVAFLPLRKPLLLFAIVPGFFFTLLTTGYNPTVTTLFQYNAYWIFYIFPASAIALRMIGGQSPLPSIEPTPAEPSGNIRRRAALVSLVFLSVVTSFHFGALIQRKSFKSGFSSKIEFAISADEWKRYRDMRVLADMVPQDVSLAATEHVAPHVSARVSLYCFRDSIGAAEYILYGALDKNSKNAKTLKELLRAGKIGVVADRGDFILFKKGAPTTRNAEFEKKF